MSNFCETDSKFNNITMYFKNSTSNDSKYKKFIFSINDAKQSRYIKNNFLKEDLKSDKFIEIPDKLYDEIRGHDLCYFIGLWKGTMLLEIDNYKIYNTQFNLKDILSNKSPH